MLSFLCKIMQKVLLPCNIVENAFPLLTSASADYILMRVPVPFIYYISIDVCRTRDKKVDIIEDAIKNVKKFALIKNMIIFVDRNTKQS